MHDITQSQLIRQKHYVSNAIDVLMRLVREGRLDGSDRNVTAAVSGLESAYDNLCRLLLDHEHPDAVAARQAGAQTLRKLGYEMNKWGFLDPDATITIDPDNPPVSGQHRLTAMAAESAAPVVKMPDLAEITERFSEFSDDEIIDPLLVQLADQRSDPGDYCLNHQGNIARGARLEDHAAPCTLCNSDGHAACQHAD